MIPNTNQNNGNGYQPVSRFNLGIQAFQRILEKLQIANDIGNYARRKYKEKTIISYFNSLETLYIPLSPVLLTEDKDFIEKEIKEIKTKNIDTYNLTISGDVVKLVEKLTELEKVMYNSIQKINMYIILDKSFHKTSKKKELEEHLEGSDIPDIDDDFSDLQ
jgi:hypothetical protein